MHDWLMGTGGLIGAVLTLLLTALSLFNRDPAKQERQRNVRPELDHPEKQRDPRKALSGEVQDIITLMGKHTGRWKKRMHDWQYRDPKTNKTTEVHRGGKWIWTTSGYKVFWKGAERKALKRACKALQQLMREHVLAQARTDIQRTCGTGSKGPS